VGKTTVAGEKYLYLVTAVDASGESNALGSVSVTPLVLDKKPFSVSLVEPLETTINLDETKQIAFVLSIESTQFEELQDLKAVLINDELGLNKEFSFDSQKKLFSVSVTAPEKEEEVFQTTYKIQVSASLAGKPFSEAMDVDLTFVTKTQFDYLIFAQNIFTAFAPLFIILFAAAPIGLFWWKWSLHRKAKRESINLELLEVQKERIICKHDYFKRNITSDQFKEKERELQGKQVALEEKLGLHKEKAKVKVNPFQGFAPTEAGEVIRLVKSIGVPKKGETEDSLRARLVGLGRNEKIAKKTAELVFRRH